MSPGVQSKAAARTHASRSPKMDAGDPSGMAGEAASNSTVGAGDAAAGDFIQAIQAWDLAHRRGLAAISTLGM